MTADSAVASAAVNCAETRARLATAPRRRWDTADLCCPVALPAGVPKLKLGPMRVAMNADSWKLCKPEAAPRHIVLNYSINQCPEGGRQCTVSWTGLEAKEEYCSVQDFYAGRHAHCKASIASHFADDLRLLYGDSEH